MFDTEKLILEVQLYPCLWNSANKSSHDRSARKLAWEQVAKSLYNEWSSYSATKKHETIDELQKKWKHYRDYYIREKKKDIISGNPNRRKKNTPYFEILSYLDITIENRHADYSAQKSFENSANISLPSSSPAPSPNESPPERIKRKRERRPSFSNIDISKLAETEKTADDEHDKNFLMSLLPDMRTMTEREKFEFKFEIMSAIKRIKYSNPIQVSSESPSSSKQFQHECKIEYQSQSSASDSDNPSD